MKLSLSHFRWPGLFLLLFLLAGWAGGGTLKADQMVLGLAAQVRSEIPGLSRLAAAATGLGGATVTLSLALFAMAWLLYLRRPSLALILALAVLAERALVDWLKILVGRERPEGGELMVESMAYPSGHAANSMTVFLVIALLAVPARHRGAAVILAISCSLLVGLTRVLLGVHWPSDVVGGWALGLAAAMTAALFARRLAPRDLEAQHEVVRRHGVPGGEDETP